MFLGEKQIASQVVEAPKDSGSFAREFNTIAQLDNDFFSVGSSSASEAVLSDSGKNSGFGGCEGKKTFKIGKKRVFSGREEKNEKGRGKPSAQKIIDKRAKRKGFSVVLAKSMIEYAKKSKSPMLGTYYRALGCSDTLIQEDGKLHAQYCKSRICVVCGAIRTAKAMKAYLPVIRGWDSYLVTLTIPNVKGYLVRQTIDEMLKKFKGAQRSIKRKILFKGLRKVEVTYNPKRDDYHAHFHCVVDGFTQAQWLREEWMKRNPAARAVAQDVRKCNKKTLKEAFKYSMKILASDEDNKNQNPHLYPHAVDTIVRALHKRRTYQNFGFKLAKEFDEDDFDGEALAAPDGNIEVGAVWTWIQEAHNWVNKATGELLSEYKPSIRRLKFLERLDSG